MSLNVFEELKLYLLPGMDLQEVQNAQNIVFVLCRLTESRDKHYGVFQYCFVTIISWCLCCPSSLICNLSEGKTTYSVQ